MANPLSAGEVSSLQLKIDYLLQQVAAGADQVAALQEDLGQSAQTSISLDAQVLGELSTALLQLEAGGQLNVQQEQVLAWLRSFSIPGDEYINAAESDGLVSASGPWDRNARWFSDGPHSKQLLRIEDARLTEQKLMEILRAIAHSQVTIGSPAWRSEALQAFSDGGPFYDLTLQNLIGLGRFVEAFGAVTNDGVDLKSALLGLINRRREALEAKNLITFNPELSLTVESPTSSVMDLPPLTNEEISKLAELATLLEDLSLMDAAGKEIPDPEAQQLIADLNAAAEDPNTNATRLKIAEAEAYLAASTTNLIFPTTAGTSSELNLEPLHRAINYIQQLGEANAIELDSDMLLTNLHALGIHHKKVELFTSALAQLERRLSHLLVSKSETSEVELHAFIRQHADLIAVALILGGEGRNPQAQNLIAILSPASSPKVRGVLARMQHSVLGHFIYTAENYVLVAKVSLAPSAETPIESEFSWLEWIEEESSNKAFMYEEEKDEWLRQLTTELGEPPQASPKEIEDHIKVLFARRLQKIGEEKVARFEIFLKRYHSEPTHSPDKNRFAYELMKEARELSPRRYSSLEEFINEMANYTQEEILAKTWVDHYRIHARRISGLVQTITLPLWAKRANDYLHPRVPQNGSGIRANHLSVLPRSIEGNNFGFLGERAEPRVNRLEDAREAQRRATEGQSPERGALTDIKKSLKNRGADIINITKRGPKGNGHK